MKQLSIVVLIIFLLTPFTFLQANNHDLEIGRVYTLEELNGLVPEQVLADFKLIQEGRPVMALTGVMVENGGRLQYPLVRIGNIEIKLGASFEGTYFENLNDELDFQILAGQDANAEFVASVENGETFLIFVALENPNGEENRGIAHYPMTDTEGNEYAPSAVVECISQGVCPALETHYENRTDPFATLAVEGFLVNISFVDIPDETRTNLEIGRVYTLEELDGLLPEGVLNDFEQVREGRPVMALTGRLVDNGGGRQYPIMRIGRIQIKLGISREGTYYEDLSDDLNYQVLAGQDANAEFIADVRNSEGFLVFVALENPNGEENRGIDDYPMTDRDGNEYTPSAVVECLANQHCPHLQTHFASNNNDPYATLSVEGFLVNLRSSSRVRAENTEQPENDDEEETEGINLNVMYSPAELQERLPEAIWGRVEARMTELGNISFVGLMVSMEDFGDVARGQSSGTAPRVDINGRAVFIMGIFPELIRSIDASSETATFTDIGAQSLGVEAQRHISDGEAFLLIIPVEPNGDSEVFNNQHHDVDFQGNFRDGSRISYRDALDLILSGQGDDVETVDSRTGDPVVYVSMMIFNLPQESPQ